MMHHSYTRMGRSQFERRSRPTIVTRHDRRFFDALVGLVTAALLVVLCGPTLP